MVPYVYDDTLDPLEQELHLLRWFKDNLPKSNKKLLKMSLYVRPLIPEHFQRSVCDNLENPRTVDPLKWMKACLREMDEYPKIIQRLIDEGNHGMILDKGTFYGISLKANKRWLNGTKEELWTEEDEMEIGNQAVKLWMIEHHRRYFDDRYLLFDEFGFSGISHKGSWEIPADEWEKVVRPKRNEERKHKKLTEELSKYVNL